MNRSCLIKTVLIFFLVFIFLYGCVSTPKRDIPAPLPESASSLPVDAIDQKSKDWKNEAINEFSLKRNEIHNSFLAGNYSQVITLCLELEKEFGSNSLTPEIEILFAFAMAENGMLQEAIDMGESVLKELHARPDLINLMAGLIKWELKLGNMENALGLYEKMLDNMHEKNAILDSAGKSVSAEKRPIPYEPRLDRDVIGEIDKTRSAEVTGLLDVVKRLIKNESYSDAKLLLLKWRLRAEEGPETELIEKALKEVEYAEAGNNKLNNEVKIINEAKSLIEGEKFEEAISLLDSRSIEGGEIDHEVLRLKELAIEKLIEREHLAAARSFLMAKKSIDRLEKETLLKSSLEILNMLIEKYPSSPSIDKINNHITRVRNELDKLTEK